MATQIWVNIASGNGLLPDGTKPLPEPMLTYHQEGPVAFTWVQFYQRYLSHQSFENYLSKILFKSPRDQWVNILEPEKIYSYSAADIFRYIFLSERLLFI